MGRIPREEFMQNEHSHEMRREFIPQVHPPRVPLFVPPQQGNFWTPKTNTNPVEETLLAGSHANQQQYAEIQRSLKSPFVGRFEETEGISAMLNAGLTAKAGEWASHVLGT